MRIVVREIRTFLVTHTTEDGTEISGAVAERAVLNDVLKGVGTVHSCEEVQEARDLTLWKVEIEERHIVNV